MFRSKCSILPLAILVVLFISTITCQRELCRAFEKECNADEFVVGGKRMELFSREKNWPDAKAHCEDMGMRLLTPASKAEMDQLIIYLNSRIWDGRPDVQFWNLWLGANDIEQNNVWTWKTTGDNLTYTSWSKDEPNGGDVENCLELKLIYFTTAWWNDAKCGDRKRYICEKADGGLT